MSAGPAARITYFRALTGEGSARQTRPIDTGEEQKRRKLGALGEVEMARTLIAVKAAAAGPERINIRATGRREIIASHANAAGRANFKSSPIARRRRRVHFIVLLIVGGLGGRVKPPCRCASMPSRARRVGDTMDLRLRPRSTLSVSTRTLTQHRLLWHDVHSAAAIDQRPR